MIGYECTDINVKNQLASRIRTEPLVFRLIPNALPKVKFVTNFHTGVTYIPSVMANVFRIKVPHADIL